MHSFHAEMSSVQIPTCSTCMETFPGMKINSRTSECQRCTRDRREPKLYSSFNNMHPGAVPISSPICQTYPGLHEVQCRYSYLQNAECKVHRSVYTLLPCECLCKGNVTNTVKTKLSLTLDSCADIMLE